MDAITVKNLSVAYDDRLIIKDMSITIPKGKITVIIGSNGCGKSTLLKSISRVLKPKVGDIFINKNNIKNQKEKFLATQIAFLPQSPICPNGLTVEELVAYGRFPHQKMTGGLNKHDREIINWAIVETDLKEYKDREVDELSQGQRQRAWIAMTLAQETDIIMLDEPTTYLDISYQLEVLQLLKKLNRKKAITIVMVLHELNNASRYADNIVGLKSGEIIFEGSPLDVINNENLSKIYGVKAQLQLSVDKSYPLIVDYNITR